MSEFDSEIRHLFFETTAEAASSGETEVFSYVLKRVLTSELVHFDEVIAFIDAGYGESYVHADYTEVGNWLTLKEIAVEYLVEQDVQRQLDAVTKQHMAFVFGPTGIQTPDKVWPI